MSDNSYIHKLQRARRKSVISTRYILMTLILSGAVYGGFYFEFGAIGDEVCGGTCESLHSIQAWVLAVVMIFAAVIAVAAVIGGLIAFIKWSRRGKSDTLSRLLEENEKNNAP